MRVKIPPYYVNMIQLFTHMGHIIPGPYKMPMGGRTPDRGDGVMDFGAWFCRRIVFFGDVYIYDNFLSTFSTNIIKNLFFITDNMINQIIFDFNFFY